MRLPGLDLHSPQGVLKRLEEGGYVLYGTYNADCGENYSRINCA